MILLLGCICRTVGLFYNVNHIKMIALKILKIISCLSMKFSIEKGGTLHKMTDNALREYH